MTIPAAPVQGFVSNHLVSGEIVDSDSTSFREMVLDLERQIVIISRSPNAGIDQMSSSVVAGLNYCSTIFHFYQSSTQGMKNKGMSAGDGCHMPHDLWKKPSRNSLRIRESGIKSIVLSTHTEEAEVSLMNGAGQCKESPVIPSFNMNLRGGAIAESAPFPEYFSRTRAIEFVANC